MGDGQKGDLRVDFDRRVKLTFLGSKVTTDAGLLAYRELDEVFGIPTRSRPGKRLMIAEWSRLVESRGRLLLSRPRGRRPLRSPATIPAPDRTAEIVRRGPNGVDVPGEGAAAGRNGELRPLTNVVYDWPGITISSGSLKRLMTFFATAAWAATNNTNSRRSCGSQSIAVWQATKTSTMPSGSEPIRPCVTLWVQGKPTREAGSFDE